MVIVYVPFLIAVIIHTLPAPVPLGSTATAVTSGDFKVCPAESVRFALSPRLIVRVPDEVVTGAVTVTAIACAGLLPAVFVAVTVTVAGPTLTPLMVRVPFDSLAVATAVALDDTAYERLAPSNTVLRVTVWAPP